MNLKEQVKQQFETKSNEQSDFYDAMMYEDYDLNSFENLQVKVEDQFGGEGEGDTYYTVYSFTDGTSTAYVRFNGWYASYNGAEYQDWQFVKPEEKTITVYVSDKE